MAVNNFELVRNNLNFINERTVYFIQILKRRKENPDMKGDTKVIDSYYIYSKEQFDKVMHHIIEKCEANKARAYIKMNALDAQSVMLAQITQLSQEIRNENWRAMTSTLDSACGSCGAQKGQQKLYLVDLDDIKIWSKEMNDTKDFINSLPPFEKKVTIYKDDIPYIVSVPISNKVVMEIPTRNGCHLLTTGFNMKKFKDNPKYSKVDVHENGNTLLYFPESGN